MGRSLFSFYRIQRAYFVLFVSFLGVIFSVGSISAQDESVVLLSWLGSKTPGIATGVSWGVPFNEGIIHSGDNFELTSSNGDVLPLQSWTLAYWPDGSLKWVGFGTVVKPENGTGFLLKPLKTAVVHSDIKLVLNETNNAVQINTGILQCEIPKKGDKIISVLKINDKVVASGGKLVCIKQNGPETDLGIQPAKEKFIGQVNKVTIEQSGPVRAVVKIEGMHFSVSGDNNWLPFVVRLYFYAGQQSVKMMHTIIYDGDQNKDFIRGLGVAFDIPMDEELYNRHIRFSGENNGLWDEPVEALSGSAPLMDNGDNLYARQLKGERIANRNTFSEKQQFMIDNWATWNDFKLLQSSADGFRIQKRTNDLSAWIDAGAGARSSGMAFVGDVSGGLAVCIRNFWQSFPAALEIRNAKTNQAQLNAWFWSPDGPAMDMRHYDTLAWGHSLAATYEDVQPGFSTPHGVGRTSELLLFASGDVPSYETLNHVAQQGNNPPLLTASPEYLHSISVFGAWSLPDRSTKGKQWVENQLDNALKYYKLEVEQSNWYGYWDFGDVMHGYDSTRHVWKYDVGGYAWDNTELMPNLWLWYSFLRTGREDVFRMAEAMTRHTGEVDVYHLGRFEGLGSRHNVRHWGCGAKEVRIAQAALGRFYYYLTTDERVGDLMHASVEASNRAIGITDPVRLIMEKSQYPTHARVGPDWLALVGNWMTEWERTGNTLYRDKILTGVNSLSEMPYGMFSGHNAAFGYDPATNKLYRLDKNDIGYLHLSVLMGGPEVAFELSPLLDNKKWDKLWLQFCKIYGTSQDNIEKEFGKRVKLGDPEPWFARLPAYYSKIKGDTAYGKRAWNEFLDSGTKRGHTDFTMKKFDGIESLEPVFEVEGVSTNNTAQWCLNAIELLELAGDQIPEDDPLFQETK